MRVIIDDSKETLQAIFFLVPVSSKGHYWTELAVKIIEKGLSNHFEVFFENGVEKIIAKTAIQAQEINLSDLRTRGALFQSELSTLIDKTIRAIQVHEVIRDFEKKKENQS